MPSQEIQLAFGLFSNQDGKMAIKDLGPLLSYMHIPHTIVDLYEMTAMVQPDEHGCISFDELAAIFNSRDSAENGEGPETIGEADKNNDNDMFARTHPPIGKTLSIMTKFGHLRNAFIYIMEPIPTVEPGYMSWELTCFWLV
jgi:hypothetical protein